MTAVERAEREVRDFETVVVTTARMVVEGQLGVESLRLSLDYLDAAKGRIDTAKRRLKNERARATRAKNARASK